MVSGRTCSLTANLQDEIDPEHLEKEHEYRDRQQEHGEKQRTINGDTHHLESEDSPGKILLDSVSDILSSSAQSMKEFVSGSRASAAGNGMADPHEETFLQSVEEKYARPTQSSTELHNDSGETPNGDGREERTLFQSMGERIADSVKNVKEAVNGSSDKMTSDADETGEASILVHSILD